MFSSFESFLSALLICYPFMYYYYNYNRFMAPWTLSGTTWVSWYQRVNHEGKTNLDLLEQEIVSGSGII